jgi:hypothetical protein
MQMAHQSPMARIQAVTAARAERILSLDPRSAKFWRPILVWLIGLIGPAALI